MAGPRGYSVAFARDMIPEKMVPYSTALPPIYDKYKGAYIAIGGPGRGVDWLAGDWTNRSIMIGEFPSRAAVGDFWWSPEYGAAAKLRAGAVTVDVAQVGGTDTVADDSLRSFLLIAVPRGMAWTPPTDDSGSVLFAVDAADVTILEGDLTNISLTVIGYPSRDSLDAAWARSSDELGALDARVCAVSRAP